MRRSCSPGAETKMGLRPAARVGSINPSKNTHPKAGVTASTIGNEPAFGLLSWRCLRLVYIFARSPTEDHIHVRARRLVRSFESFAALGYFRANKTRDMGSAVETLETCFDFSMTSDGSLYCPERIRPPGLRTHRSVLAGVHSFTTGH